MHRVHVVHDDDGRILALADAADVVGPDGVVLRHQPRPRPGQHAVVVELAEDQRQYHALSLIREFDLDVSVLPPVLRRRHDG